MRWRKKRTVPQINKLEIRPSECPIGHWEPGMGPCVCGGRVHMAAGGLCQYHHYGGPEFGDHAIYSWLDGHFTGERCDKAPIYSLTEWCFGHNRPNQVCETLNPSYGCVYGLRAERIKK